MFSSFGVPKAGESGMFSSTLNEYALPTLLGNSRTLQFWRHVEREPDVFEKRLFAAQESPSPVAKKKLRVTSGKKKLTGTKLQPPAAKQEAHAAGPALQAARTKMACQVHPVQSKVQKWIGHGQTTMDWFKNGQKHTKDGRSSSCPVKPTKSSSSSAKPEMSKTIHVQQHSLASRNNPATEAVHDCHWNAEKSFMCAVCLGDLKKAEELLSQYGPSLLGSLSSHAVLHVARDDHEMCELLRAHFGGEASKTGRHKHLDSRLKENQSAPRRPRSASVPDASMAISDPKASTVVVAKTRARRKSIY